MMVYDEDFSKELKARLVEILAWFHEFCAENDIRYYVIAGTMLGAARHQGFIPWDDDIDVGVPRADYERLAELMREKPDSRFIYETPHSPAKDFTYVFSKLYDKNTTLIERVKIDIKRGIYIDVFPLDGIGNSFDEAARNYKKVNKTYRLYKYRSLLPVKPERKLTTNTAIVLSQLIPGFVINNKRLQLKVDEVCREYDFDKCDFVGSLLCGWQFRHVMEKKIFGTPTPYKFENITVFGVEDYDAYLTHLYGDWRKLPPEDKRVTHHNFIECNLNKSYL